MPQHIGFWAGLVLALGLLGQAPPAGLSVAAWHTAIIGLLIALWWITEALPLAVTAMLPFILLPPLVGSDVKEVAASYFSPTIFLVLGGALLARAIESTGLHRRIALHLIGHKAGTPASLLLAFMIASACISMFVSNTATTLILMPIGLSLVHAMCREDSHMPQGFATALVLGIAWSASIGGLGTLVGSPTNAIAAGLLNKTLNIHIDFITWAKFGLPLVACAIPLCWLWLKLSLRLPATVINAQDVRRAIGEAGPWSAAEKRVLPVLLGVALLWILTPLFKKYLGPWALDDGAIALAGAFLLFVIPKKRGGPALLQLEDVRQVPWDILLLFGGGLALADAITTTGLAVWIGNALQGVSAYPLWLVALLLTAIIVLVTEFASNVAAASAFVPVIAGLVLVTGFDPLMLGMMAALASSWGFMMPAGTPPNAIAFATGHVRMGQMVRLGFMVNLIGVPLMVLVATLVTRIWHP